MAIFQHIFSCSLLSKVKYEIWQIYLLVLRLLVTTHKYFFESLKLDYSQCIYLYTNCVGYYCVKIIMPSETETIVGRSLPIPLPLKTITSAYHSYNAGLLSNGTCSQNRCRGFHLHHKCENVENHQ